MTRKTIGWENRLTTYLTTVAAAAFRPGAIDCGLFAAGGVAVMTEDGAELKKFKGKYRTIEGGLALVRKKGFENHIDYVASIFEERASVLFAQRGDLAAFSTDEGGFALGIVQGENVYLMTLQGLGVRRLEEAVRAFAV